MFQLVWLVFFPSLPHDTGPVRHDGCSLALQSPVYGPVSVFISDEHQHALPRWYEHANSPRQRGMWEHGYGALDPRRCRYCYRTRLTQSPPRPHRYTLVHIDAHSDMATPTNFNFERGVYDHENLSRPFPC